MIRNKILQEDIADFYLPTELSDRLRNSTIIVTGSTGLIGSAFVRCLDSLNLGIRFVLPVRNAGKAEVLFEGETDSMEIIEIGLTEFFEKRDSPCDYIIHCASPTNGKYMCAHPAETFLLPIESTRALLDYSLRRHADRMVKGIVYLSSIEYYGRMAGTEPVREDSQGYIDTKSPRSSYALGKQSAEYLGYCYAEEYGVPFRSARLTQTFGAGIPETDKRVFAQFARSVIEGRDIILHTEGRSAKPYCYTTDCVSALIHILLKGEDGGAYNVATPGTYVSILELAHLFRDRFNPEVEVRTEILENSGYAPETLVDLNSDRLSALGWKPRYGLREMLERLVNGIKNEELRNEN